MVLPDRQLISAEVAGVMVPGREGDFTVLPGHAPVITTLRPNVVEIIDYAVVEELFTMVRPA